VGFNATFGVAIFFGVVTALILLVFMDDPVSHKQKFSETSIAVGD
jgi:hypothetical protein